MRVIFMGSPNFSVPFLEALINSEHEIVAVFSAPLAVRNKRGNKLEHCPVGKFALEHGLDLHTPKSLKSRDIQEAIKSLKPDVIIVVAYGAILPQSVLDIPRYSCINVHGSMLPRWRGAAPIERAIEAGDSETGICIMKMEAGLDTGPIALYETVPIEGLNSGEVRALLGKIGAPLLIQSLKLLEQGTLFFNEQEGEASYAKKIEKSEAKIDWSQNASFIERKIRALTPDPGTWCMMRLMSHNQTTLCEPVRVKIISASISSEPTILAKRCADGLYLSIKLCQKSGGKILTDKQFCAGYKEIEIL